MSFSELQNLYNTFFNIRDRETDSFLPMQVEKLLNYIAKIALDNLRNSFDLKIHFIYPQSPDSNFLADLRKEPLNCAKDHTAGVLEELAKKYRARDQVVST